MIREEAEIAREKRQYLEQWLASHREASEAAPDVRQALERSQWEEDALGNAPVEVAFEPDLKEQMKGELTSWQLVLPPMPLYDRGQISQVFATNSTASGSAIYTQVYQAGQEVQTPGVTNWSNRYTAEYEAIQCRHKRHEMVCEKLGLLNPRRVDEFDKAWKAAEDGQGRWLTQENAGIAMRNVLEHVKGDLWERARCRHSEAMTWRIMAQRLSKAPAGTVGRQTLLDQKSTYDTLHRELTDVAKNLTSASTRDIGSLMTRLQDHLLIVLSSVEL